MLDAPVEVLVPTTLARPESSNGLRAPAAARVAVIIVTWNRKSFVTSVLEALSKQTYARDAVDVIVVDNSSTDGTTDALAARWRPERVVRNATTKAHEPRFDARSAVANETSTPTEHANAAGFASLTIVRNDENMGGCGGFNTGFAYVEHASRHADSSPRQFAAPEFVWLVDDDVDLPTDALEQLTRVMAADDGIGLVGSRTVDIADRATTIETTIYFNPEGGSMMDEPPPGHRLRDAHRAWAAAVGGSKRGGPYSGVREVDVVSACSLLARWKAVVGERPGEEREPGATSVSPRVSEPTRGTRGEGGRAGVGFWDWRYFIYCDDADWCLRFGKAGWKVILNLDAVVYHTPWNLKLTPARIYYAQRNAIWMIQKVLPQGQLRRVTRGWLWSILRDSLRASLMRRQFHAEIIRRTAADVVAGVTGKTGSDGPPAASLGAAFAEAGVLHSGATVLLLCNRPDSLAWATAAREEVRRALRTDDVPAGSVEPRWALAVRNTVLAERGADGEAASLPPPTGWDDVIVYGGRWPSRLKKQWWMLRNRPRAVVVFEQTNDLPVVTGGWNIHVDQKKPAMAQIEREGWVSRLKFFARWLPTAAKCLWYSMTVRPYVSPTRYG